MPKNNLSNKLYKFWLNNSFERNEHLKYFRKYIKKDIQSIEIFKESIIIHLENGLKFFWDPNSYGSLNGLINNGSWEKEVTKVLTSYIKESSTVIDIGANFGWYSIHFAQKIGSLGKVHSFEPLIATNIELLSNIKLNNLNNIEVNNVGLSDKNTMEKLYYPIEKGSMFTTLKKTYRDINYLEQKCEVITLDSYIIKHKVKKVDLIKIDAEGSEIQILKGSLKVIERDLPILLVEKNEYLYEQFGFSTKDLEKILMHYNYDTYTINSDSTITQIFSLQNEKLLNVLCIPRR